jgi:hypothetical protein
VKDFWNWIVWVEAWAEESIPGAKAPFCSGWIGQAKAKAKEEADPCGMTARKAKAKNKEEADSWRERQKERQRQRPRQKTQAEAGSLGLLGVGLRWSRRRWITGGEMLRIF